MSTSSHDRPRTSPMRIPVETAVRIMARVSSSCVRARSCTASSAEMESKRHSASLSLHTFGSTWGTSVLNAYRRQAERVFRWLLTGGS